MQPLKAKFLALRVYRTRDRTAYAELYDAYEQRIRRSVSVKLPRFEDADEITGEVFLRGWEYMTANMVEYPQALFYTIARNLVATYYQTAKPTEELNDRLENAIPSTEDVAGKAVLNEAMEELRDKLDRIKPEYRDVLMMRFVDEMTVDEIAVVLGKTTNNIHVLIFRARQALKNV